MRDAPALRFPARIGRRVQILGGDPGPSLDPHDKRLAVEVEDHPLDYGDFEGTIPKGQYGGGTVQLWDRGYWEPDDPERGFKKGDLKFTLDGEKLHGSWVLVRMRHDRNGGKRTNWLLIKHRDEYRQGRRGRRHPGRGPIRRLRPDHGGDRRRQGQGAEAVHDGEVQTRQAPMRSGIRTAAMPSHAPRPRRRRRAEGQEGRRDAGFRRAAALHLGRAPAERARAGPRDQVRRLPHAVAGRGRQGHAEHPQGPRLDRQSSRPSPKRRSALPDVLIDGEIVALDHDGAPDFAALQAALSDGKTDELIFFAFDLLFAEERICARCRCRAQGAVEGTAGSAAKGKAGSIRYVEHFESRRRGRAAIGAQVSLEGIVSKKLDAPYRSGRGEGWTKAKCRAGQEVVIGGWKTTNGKFRSLLVGVHRGDHLVYVGRVGTGFGQDKVRRILPALKAEARTRARSAARTRRARPATSIG